MQYVLPHTGGACVQVVRTAVCCSRACLCVTERGLKGTEPTQGDRLYVSGLASVLVCFGLPSIERPSLGGQWQHYFFLGCRVGLNE